MSAVSINESVSFPYQFSFDASHDMKERMHLLAIFMRIAMPTLHTRNKAIMRTVVIQDAIIAIEWSGPKAVSGSCVLFTAVRPNPILHAVQVGTLNTTDRSTCNYT